MNSRNSTPSTLTNDVKDPTEQRTDEAFDESTSVRLRAPRRLPLAAGEVCEDVTRVEHEPPDVQLPTWEELTGLRMAPATGQPSSGRQLAIDLVEAEQRRQSTLAKDEVVVSGVARGGGFATLEPIETALPWVDRFARETSKLLEGAEREEERLQEASTHSPLLVPPAPASRARGEPPPPPPSSRPMTRPHIPSAFPSNAPLPRFALGPRMEGFLEPRSRPASLPASLAPVASSETVPRERTNPWLAGFLGAAIAGAIGFAFFWSPQPRIAAAPSAQGVAQPADVPAGRNEAVPRRPFEAKAAQLLAAGAAEKARACGMGKVPTEIQLTFAPDGTVVSAVATGEGRLSEDTGACMDDTLLGVRIPPFEGEPKVIRLSLR